MRIDTMLHKARNRTSYSICKYFIYISYFQSFYDVFLGNEIVNIVPLSNLLSTVIFPLCNSIIRLEMAAGQGSSELIGYGTAVIVK
ncbi:hypothetical protein QCI77_25820 [Bacillus cereus group sp. MG9]